ncbi:protein ITPRID2 isoform X1 [Patella vulgata]|uniref:protein ITPRID2 isoform X1 n=1 Tax=Patella vulgata TaxID=6465 RepID=UPI0021808B11|nr:protein ITPRID2 isoform X1 [Patella vulgata]XP_050388445.1 protein ITPRID2 isoform X1 [Patella vulgata]XP_050388446.1 protein ITPRID2 isoform X1 [Patella vulgata]
MAVKRKTGVCSQTPLPEDMFYKTEDENQNELPAQGGADSQTTGTETVSKSLDMEADEGEENDKLTPIEDDLPLGSEGKNKKTFERAHTLASDMFGSKFSALIDKRLAMLKSSQTPGGSFDSVNTSSSSINSVDMLLQERSEDPEQVLLNLGFAAGHSEMGSSLSRIPERFLLNQSRARGINLEEFLEDNPELKTFVGTLKKKGSRSGAWKAARSMSSVLFHLKMSATASKQKQMGMADLQDTGPKSILIPENQQALARQGFYTQHLGYCPKNIGQGSDVTSTPGHATQKGVTDKRLFSNPVAAKPSDAASKRKMFQKTHTQKWSLVESDESKETSNPMGASEDISPSFDKGYSMDFSTSASMDSSDSPFSPDIRFCSSSDLRQQHEADALKKMEDCYFQSAAEVNKQGIGDIRHHKVDNFLTVHDGDDYTVSPPMSKQSTVERVKTLSIGSTHDESVSDQVKIVVSQDLESVSASLASEMKADENSLNLLNIERLSDTESSSDYTVVDKHSITSLDSPDVFENQTDSVDKKELGSHMDKPDENENFPMFKFSKQTANFQESPIIRSPCLQDDLSRMGSIQSDSSGFGDADYSADMTPHESEAPRFSNLGSLGSSSESANTLASSVSTILARDFLELDNSTHKTVDSERLNVPVYSWKKIGDRLSDNRGQQPISSTPNSYFRNPAKETYISMCYIPSIGKKKLSKTSESTQVHSGTGRGHNVPFTKNHVSIFVTKEKSVERKEEKTSETRESLTSSYYSPYNVHSKGKLNQSYLVPPSSRITEQYSGNSTPELSHSWSRTGSRGAQYSKSHFHFGSRDSILSESEISYCSTPDSSTGCSGTETMEYSKLIKLINQPVSIQGYKRSIIHYKPKQHVREWTNLIRKKRLQEETCMLQYAIQKYKTELHSIETAFIIQFQQAYEELTDEERDEVEELQHLWTAIHQQLLETEHLLSQRLKKVNSGNDFFTFISTLSVLQKMILLLREQLYQQQVTIGKDDLDTEYQSSLLSHHRSHSYSGLDVPPSPFSPRHRSHHNLGTSTRLGQSLDELRDTVIKDVREELRKSTQHLHLDLQSKDNEIQRLNLELMMEKHGLLDYQRHRNTVQETDV